MGHTLTSMHSSPAPSPPSALLVWQMVFFSENPSEFSLARPASWTLRVSRTEIDPSMVKVLYFFWLVYPACTSSSQAQQFDWQI